jgi:hypothetical protein
MRGLGLGESLREICRDEDMPDKSTVMRWLALHQEFRDQYAGAREAQADYYAEEIIEISDDGSNDWMLRKQGDDELRLRTRKFWPLQASRRYPQMADGPHGAEEVRRQDNAGSDRCRRKPARTDHQPLRTP